MNAWIFLTLAIVSEVIGSTGLNAITFWVIRGKFDWTWWLPNLYLMLYPLFFIPRVLCHLIQDQRQQIIN